MKSAEPMGRSSGGIPKPGDLVGGKYQVERYVGHGGMGVVMRALHVELGKVVALKVLRPGRLEDHEAVKRFMREARAAGSIDSEHIARVIDLGTHDGLPFLVMDLLTGRGLDEVLKSEGRLPVERAVDYMLQAAVGVAEAHARGIVHRDLKPSNLFVAERPDGREVVRVLDFGVSKITGMGGSTDNVSCLTETNAAIGSPYYMSPEQLRSSKSVDHRTDIWALGVILYRLLTAQLPFPAPNIGAYLAMIVSSPVQPLSRYLPEAPARLDAVIQRCMQKRADDRYQDVGALARDLARFGGPTAASLVRRIVLVLEAAPGPAEVSDSVPPARSTPPPAQSTPPPARSTPPPAHLTPPSARPEPPDSAIPTPRGTEPMPVGARDALGSFTDDVTEPTSGPRGSDASRTAGPTAKATIRMAAADRPRSKQAPTEEPGVPPDQDGTTTRLITREKAPWEPDERDVAWRSTGMGWVVAFVVLVASAALAYFAYRAGLVPGTQPHPPKSTPRAQ